MTISPSTVHIKFILNYLICNSITYTEAAERYPVHQPPQAVMLPSPAYYSVFLSIHLAIMFTGPLLVTSVLDWLTQAGGDLREIQQAVRGEVSSINIPTTMRHLSVASVEEW
jgi:hypothetical protein